MTGSGDVECDLVILRPDVAVARDDAVLLEDAAGTPASARRCEPRVNLLSIERPSIAEGRRRTAARRASASSTRAARETRSQLSSRRRRRPSGRACRRVRRGAVRTGVALRVDAEPDRRSSRRARSARTRRARSASPRPRRRHSRAVKSRAIHAAPSRSGTQTVPATIGVRPRGRPSRAAGEKSGRSMRFRPPLLERLGLVLPVVGECGLERRVERLCLGWVERRRP